MKPVVISYAQENAYPAAYRLSKKLNLPLLAPDQISNEVFILMHTTQGLQLCFPFMPGLQPLQIDFLSPAFQHRLKLATLKNEYLARAMVVKPSAHPRIIDATAGLGRDAFLLAALGFHLTLIERSPILHALLEDGLQRARNHPDLKEIAARLTLRHADAKNYLKTLIGSEHAPNIVYLDPMFPERKKSAQVKKEMLILQNLLGDHDDSEALFQLALTCATDRVVIKRPKLASAITLRKPNYTLAGKSSRFDVYLVNHHGNNHARPANPITY